MSKMDMTFWEPFTLESLFDIVKGTRLTKNDMKEGDINYIGASAFNNGITYKIGNNEHVHPAGLLTVCYNGSIGTTFYQPEPFWATDDVNVLYPKFEMTPYIGMFIAPLIRRVGLNYAYTDKWQIEDMKKSHIYLPIDKNDKPDWAYMDAYMRKIDNRAKKNLDCLQSAITPPRISNKITVSSWKKFAIKDMFEANNTGNILIRDIEGRQFISHTNLGAIAQFHRFSKDFTSCIEDRNSTFPITTFGLDDAGHFEFEEFSIVVFFHTIYVVVFIFMLLPFFGFSELPPFSINFCFQCFRILRGQFKHNGEFVRGFPLVFFRGDKMSEIGFPNRGGAFGINRFSHC